MELLDIQVYSPSSLRLIFRKINDVEETPRKERDIHPNVIHLTNLKSMHYSSTKLSVDSIPDWNQFDIRYSNNHFP